jgi:type II secretory pathway predicted ATPase ExeA
MYTKFFGLCEYPFGLTSDLRFFYSTPLHEEVFSSICSVLRNRQGLVLLTGEPGTGKTTLLQRLTQTMDDATHVITLPLAAPTFVEILSSLCEQFALPFSPRDGLGITLTSLEEHLLRVANRRSTAVLIIDEAQHLDINTLAHFRQLLRLEGPTGKLLQIVLAGQPELEEKLTRPEVQFLHQHLASWQRLSPFPNECVGSYIRHRLAVAGCERHELFTPEAIRTVGLYSQAIPRLINVICDNALLAAYRLDLHLIPLEVIVQVVENLQLPQPPAVSTQQPTEAPAINVSHMTPRKVLMNLRASRQPLAWVSVGIAIGWFTATFQFPAVQVTHFSQGAAQTISAVENSSLTPTALHDTPQNHQASQSPSQALSTPPAALLPSTSPVVAAAFVPSEPSVNATVATRSTQALSPTFPATGQPSVSPPTHTFSAQDTTQIPKSGSPSAAVFPNVPPAASQRPISREVARIIAILKHPISPTFQDEAPTTSIRPPSSTPLAARKRSSKVH